MSLADDIDTDLKLKPNKEEKKFVPQGINAVELAALKLPPMKWAIEGIVPEGACILAGAPKIGKSWLAFDLALAVAHGGVALGKIPVEQGKVLYLALEDGKRRLQSRLLQLLRPSDGNPSPDLTFFTRWASYRDGGLTALKEQMEERKPRLVVIDTLARIQDRRGPNEGVYQADYETVAPLQEIGLEMGIAIVLVTHVRKSKSMTIVTDPLEEVTGSMGLTGAADVILVLKRIREENDGTLFVTGRDVEERKIPIAWDGRSRRWCIVEADPAHDPDAGCTQEQRKLLGVLRDVARPISPAEVAKILGKGANTVAQTLKRMHEAGLAERASHGKYTAPCHSMSHCHNDTMTENDTHCTKEGIHPTPFG